MVTHARAMSPEASDPHASLRRMKIIATALFVIAAIIFIVSKKYEESSTAWGYVRAGSEAAMIGALADWFAVVALFRHPLGLPIPHTAIIQKRKDQIGSSLGGFVRDNFLTKEVIVDRLSDAYLARRIGGWLAQGENAKRLSAQSATALAGMGEVLHDDVVAKAIEDLVVAKANDIDVTPLVGKGLEVAVDGGHHNVLFDGALTGLGGFLQEQKQVFADRFAEESPWWLPATVDDRIFAKVYAAVTVFIDEVIADKDHELRHEFSRRFAALAQTLQTSPEAAAKGAELKAEVLSHDEVRAWIYSLWEQIKSGLMTASRDPNSQLRLRLEEAISSIGERLQEDEQLQTKVDDWITQALSYVAQEFRGEVSGLISSTVEGWDSKETAERLELQVGKDLQFIRINGTIVGGLAGVLIHLLSQTLL